MSLSPSHFVMAEKVNVLAPHDMWPFSTVIEEDLQSLIDRGLLYPLNFVVPPNGSFLGMRRS